MKKTKQSLQISIPRLPNYFNILPPKRLIIATRSLSFPKDMTTKYEFCFSAFPKEKPLKSRQNGGRRMDPCSMSHCLPPRSLRMASIQADSQFTAILQNGSRLATNVCSKLPISSGSSRGCPKQRSSSTPTGASKTPIKDSRNYSNSHATNPSVEMLTILSSLRQNVIRRMSFAERYGG